jgi:hypothetical protein
MIPQAKIVILPEEVGPSGDITDYFVRWKHTKEDFECLLKAARPLPPEPPRELPVVRPLNLSSERVAKVKSAFSIVEVIGETVSLRPSGANFTGRCPFHEDRTPSFVVYPATGTFHCFGCCAHGDVTSFYMKIHNTSFLQALKALEGLALPHARTANE